MQGTYVSSGDRRKLIAFQNYLERNYTLTGYQMADISDYVKARFCARKISRKKSKVVEISERIPLLLRQHRNG